MCSPSIADFRQAPFRGLLPAVVGLLLILTPALSSAQTADSERPVPLLTGSAGFFTNVNGGETQLAPVIAPVLLVPLGDRWLIESRASFEGEFERKAGDGPYGGTVGKEVDYAQLDFIANRYLTVTAGRFLTPFGIYNERLYPIWIRSLQREPLIFPIATGASDGVMLRGGFPVNECHLAAGVRQSSEMEGEHDADHGFQLFSSRLDLDLGEAPRFIPFSRQF